MIKAVKAMEQASLLVLLSLGRKAGVHLSSTTTIVVVVAVVEFPLISLKMKVR